MIFRIFKLYNTGKMLYNRVLKPVYEELRKDAYENEPSTIKRKRTKKNVDDKKPKRSNRRKKDS